MVNTRAADRNTGGCRCRLHCHPLNHAPQNDFLAFMHPADALRPLPSSLRQYQIRERERARCLATRLAQDRCPTGLKGGVDRRFPQPRTYHCWCFRPAPQDSGLRAGITERAGETRLVALTPVSSCRAIANMCLFE